MSWNRTAAIIIFIFLLALIFTGCEKNTQTENKASQPAGLNEDKKEVTGILGPEHKYSVGPGSHLLKFKVKLPYAQGYDDVQFTVEKNELESLGINAEVDGVVLESYFHPIWTVNAREGFMGLQKELFTRVGDAWVISMSDVEATGRLSESEIARVLSNRKYHYMNKKTKRMEFSSEELSVLPGEGQSYIAEVDVRVELPDGEYNIDTKSLVLKGSPAGNMKLTLSRPDKAGPVIIVGPNDKIPNE